MSQDKAVIFLHISKTGGTTLRSVIQRQYAKDETYDLDASYFVSESEKYDAVLQERVALLEAMSDAEKSRYRCFFHPAAYGLHKILPQECEYFTFLRDPIDRFISSYYFSVNNVGHIHHQLIEREKLSIEAFAERLPINNLQTRRLSGVDPISRSQSLKPELDESDLQKAKDNPAQMPIFGLTERYDESMLLLQEVFAWKDVSYMAKNVAPKRIKLQDLSPQLRQTLETSLALDIELYHFAEKRFEEFFAASRLNFPQALESYRSRNKRLAQIASVKKRVRGFVHSIKARF